MPENDLPQVSTALVFQVRAIDRPCLMERMGTVSAEVLGEILKKLGNLTGKNRQVLRLLASCRTEGVASRNCNQIFADYASLSTWNLAHGSLFLGHYR